MASYTPAVMSLPPLWSHQWWVNGVPTATAGLTKPHITRRRGLEPILSFRCTSAATRIATKVKELSAYVSGYCNYGHYLCLNLTCSILVRGRPTAYPRRQTQRRIAKDAEGQDYSYATAYALRILLFCYMEDLAIE